MILAAGFGTRLLPHTHLRPKPLFPILNTPLLLLTIRRLQRAGFRHIIVNCHHLRKQIVTALDGLPGVVVQEEDTILGTGGGLRRAVPLMRDEPLLITNGDIYHTVDYRGLYQAHVAGGAGATLGMHHFPRFNTIAVVGDRIAGFSKEEGGNILAFTGLHVLQPELLLRLRDGACSCIIDLYRALLKESQALNVYRVDECFWTDMGTEHDYLELHGGLLRGEIPCWPEIGLQQEQRPFLVDDAAKIRGDCEMQDWVSLGSAKVGRDVHLARTVVWDDVEIPAGTILSDTLVSKWPPAIEVAE